MQQNHRIFRVANAWSLAAAMMLCALPAQAGLVSYWRFEEGPADANVSHGGQADGVFYAGTMDSSGNNNHLSVWAEGYAGFAYRTDKPAATIPQTGAANSFSVQNTGSWPAMWCPSLKTWSPLAWTIEVSFQPELTDGHRTLVGRDSRTTATVNGDLSALYLQIQPDESLAIKFCDVGGFWHEAISAANLVQGFTFPNSAAGQWQAAAAVSDGSTLSLYYKNIENGDINYTLVAQTDMTLGGSPNRAMSVGAGDGGDWDAGDFTVGRGLYAGGHGDRAYGFIDEVRMSDTALTQSEFLYTIPEPNTVLLGLLGGAALLLRRRRNPRYPS